VWFLLTASQAKADDDTPNRIVVNLTATANDPLWPGRSLNYSWKVSEGSITNVNSPRTTWTLPAGPGVHFANLLVSNRAGGYTERRIAVISDNLGISVKKYPPQDFSPATIPGTVDSADSVLVTVPSPTFTEADEIYGFPRAVFLPDFLYTYTNDLGINVTTSSNQSGRIDYLNATHNNLIGDNNPGAILCCADIGGTSGGLPHSHIVYADVSAQTFNQYIVGSVALRDDSLCGTDNKLHAVKSAAQVTLLDRLYKPLGPSARVNSFGDYALPFNPLAWSIKVQCETNQPVIVTFDPVSLIADKATFTSAVQPAVTNIVADINGQSLGNQAVFFPTETGTGAPFSRSDLFLATKGLDSRQSACEYYRLTGAVSSCDRTGNPANAITFDDWKRKVGLAPYQFTSPAATEYKATYINHADLNLTRNHHAITYPGGTVNRTSAYVCNHLGLGADTQKTIDAALQAKIDTAIDNAVNGKNLVACVAQDYGYEFDKNGQPYVRYYIFAANGQLMQSINLDGRGEKFMPGSCVACHGGEKYDGQFPTNGKGSPNYGGYFLPFDVANFFFSSKPGLTKADQQEAIYNLNKTVQNGNMTQVASSLIDQWYLDYQPGVNTPVQNEKYVPSNWIANVDSNGLDPAEIYSKVEAPYCRSCHVALATDVEDTGTDLGRIQRHICGGSQHIAFNHSMPNSLVTFNRMWADPDAVDVINRWVGLGNCGNAPFPDPKLNH
jgi:hypothetical protein